MSLSRANWLVLVAVSGCAMAGCALTQSHYATPPLDVPDQWQKGAQSPEAPSAGHGEAWWRDFADDNLNRLVEEALQRNADLAAAAIRVRRAQLQAQLAGNQLFPSVEGSIDVSDTRTLYTPRYTVKSSGATLLASYEIDLWGRLASLRNAARWEAQATEEDRASAALALIGTVMKLYWQSAYVAQSLSLSDQSIAYAQQTLNLIKTQFRAGAVTTLEIVQAEQNLITQQTNHSQLLLEQEQTRNALALLFDAPPERQWVTASDLSAAVVPDLDAGIPASVLSRRPDVHAAELRLREVLAEVDATRASFYPTFSLTGSLATGTAGLVTTSTSLANVLKNPVATLGAGVTLPFLQWRDAKLTIGISKTEYAEAVVEFRKSFYQALSDVENALSARAQLAAQGGLLQESLDKARIAEHLNEVRYGAGAVALTAWLDAQEARRDAENALAANQLDQLSNQVVLYQSLGGSPQAARQPE